MSLLFNKDPSYWLAKIIAAPDKTTYRSSDFRDIVFASTQVASAANIAAQQAYQDSAIVVFHQDELDAALQPMLDRVSAYNQKYSTLLQNLTADTVDAPDLKADGVELLTYVQASLVALQGIEDSVTWYEGLFGGLAEVTVTWATKLYAALAGAIAAALSTLSLAAKLAIVTVAVGGGGYVVYRGVELSRARSRGKKRISP